MFRHVVLFSHASSLDKLAPKFWEFLNRVQFVVFKAVKITVELPSKSLYRVYHVKQRWVEEVIYDLWGVWGDAEIILKKKCFSYSR